MIDEPLVADSALPGLETATTPDSMRRIFEDHLRPAGETAYEIKGCGLTRVRYRKGERCVLQYALELSDPITGARRTQWVAGVMYKGGKTRHKWEKLLKSETKAPIACPAFEPLTYVPELDMLIEVFPYDRRLPGLPVLMAGPSPELEAPLLANLEPGRRIRDWNVELVRYRAELGATVRISAQTEEEATGQTEVRRFYAKIYSDEAGESVHGVLEAIHNRRRGRSAFSVGKPIAYLGDLRTLIQEETPGTTLKDILLSDKGAKSAVRRTAISLAELHLTEDLRPPRLHTLGDEISALERTGNLLRWACPHLEARIDSAVGAVISNLEEVPPTPTHLDLKLDHILLDGEQTSLIDMDDFAGADPLLDAAGVMVRLSNMPLLFPTFDGETGSVYRRIFADEYFSRVPGTWREGLPAHYAGAALKMAVGFFRRGTEGWLEKIETLLNTAEESLADRS